MDERSKQLERDDPHFLRDLDASEPSILVAMDVLRSWGFTVQRDPTRKRPSVEQRAAFSDSGDLKVLQVVQVKQRPDLQFNSVAEFKYPTVIVDECHKFDRIYPRPWVYLCFNKELTGYLLIDCSTFDKWSKVTLFDRKKNREVTCYEVPKELTEFRPVSFGAKEG